MVDVHARYIGALEHERPARSRRLEALPDEQAARRAPGRRRRADDARAGGAAGVHEDGPRRRDPRVRPPRRPVRRPELVAYFPERCGERFADRMARHRLRREIIATVLVNEMVEPGGHPLRVPHGARRPAPSARHRCGRTWWRARSSTSPAQWDAVAELGTAVPAEVQLGLLLDLRKMVERGSQWLLRHRRPPLAVADTVASFRPGVATLTDALPAVISPGLATAMAEAAEAATAAGVPADLAAGAARWPYLHTAFDIVEVAHARGRTPEDAARVYWGLFDLLDLAWLWDRVGTLPRSNRWQNHARAGLRDDLLNELRALADEALRAGDVFTPVADVLQQWAAANERATARLATVLGEIRSGGTFDLTTLSVALRQLHNLVQASGTVV